MPPLRFGGQRDYAKEKRSTFCRVTRGDAQDYAGENETTTPGWVLMNIGGRYEAKSFAGNNLLDPNIRNSTSNRQGFAPEPGRGVHLGLQISH